MTNFTNLTNKETPMTIFDACYIWEAENPTAVGSKVVNSDAFRSYLAEALENHDTSNDWARGQHKVELPSEALDTVSCGVGKRSENKEDYVLRNWRHRVGAYLKREFAAPCVKCSVIVYDREAYLADPQMPPKERERVLRGNATHFLVALLANGGEPDARSPYRLVDSLAGGNNARSNWSLEDIYKMAEESRNFADNWDTVAD